MDPVHYTWSFIMVHLVPKVQGLYMEVLKWTRSSPPGPKVWSTRSNSRIQERRQIKVIDTPKVQGLWSFIRRISNGPSPVHLALHYGSLGPKSEDQVQST